MAIPAGTLLGRYQVISLLGTGGMGEVYKARDAELGRDVAIKLLPSELKANPSSHRQLEREARAAAAVTHPHICSLYDLVHEGGFDFIVMELLEGETLAARLSRGPMPIEEVVAVAIDISEALAAAHRRRLIHRDLKPTNVMLTATHGAKLLDFGIAKIKLDAALNGFSDVTSGTGSTRTGVLVGTLQYMSPEQLQGLPIDGRADVFALGAVVYEMLTGCRAFDATAPGETIAAILESAPAPIGSHRAGVPAALTRIVETCLAKMPSNRWQSADDLAHALKVVAARSASSHPKLRRDDARPHPPRIRTLAVLPFENVPPNHGQQHVADGLTENLIASISVIGRLKVISRSSVMRYRARETPLQEICRELQVDGVVRGKVCPGAGRLKVSVELLKAPDGAILWREEYDRPATDFFRVQGEIAETIAAEMQLKLTPN
jgi:serine/threonine protein kinase